MIRALVVTALLWLPAAAKADSVCFGTSDRGALRDACQLPRSGDNFSAYTGLASLLGRTYVHCTVNKVIASAYETLARTQPGAHFVYGETGFATGGPFKPHKTHQNGLSVDFFVPVRNARGESVPLPTSALNRWGYDIEFGNNGRFDDLSIDFEALGQHLVALHAAAERHNIRIARVIFDTELQSHLRRTRAWSSLQGKVQFSTRRGWWRHDEHYHVDFDLPCRPYSER